MKTLQEFVDKWKTHMVGFGMYGIYTETFGGPLERAAHAIKVIPEAERLLKAIYEYLSENKEPLPIHPAGNGPPGQPKTRK